MRNETRDDGAVESFSLLFKRFFLYIIRKAMRGTQTTLNSVRADLTRPVFSLSLLRSFVLHCWIVASPECSWSPYYFFVNVKLRKSYKDFKVNIERSLKKVRKIKNNWKKIEFIRLYQTIAKIAWTNFSNKYLDCIKFLKKPFVI